MAIDSGIYGADVSAISIIVVYHLFSIQTWLQAALSLESEVEAVRSDTVAGDLERVDATKRTKLHMRRFPWVTVVVLGGAVAGLGLLAWCAGRALPGVPLRYTGGPVVVLLATFAIATVGTWVQGYRILVTAAKDL
jgi:hypothetical protein